MKIGDKTVDEIIVVGNDGELLATITDDDVVSKKDIIIDFVTRDCCQSRHQD